MTLRIAPYFRLLSLLTALLLTLPASGREAQDTVPELTGRYLLMHMPGEGLQLISVPTRQDMADYYEAGQKYSPLNELRGECTLTRLTAEEFMVDVTPVSSVQGCVLPVSKGREMAVAVYTVDGSSLATLSDEKDKAVSADSQITFYDALMRPLPTGKHFREPVLTDFMQKGPEAKQAMQLVPFLLVSYELVCHEKEIMLTATLNVEGSMTEEDYKKLRPHIATLTLNYLWNPGKRRFELLGK